MFRAFLLALVACVLTSVSAVAGVVHYKFSANWQLELDGGNTVLDASNSLFQLGDVLRGQFAYDSSAPQVGTFGPFLVYAPALSGLSASVNGNSLSSAFGSGLVANDHDFCCGNIDLLILNSTADVPPHAFSGFAIGDFALRSFRLSFSDYNASLFAAPILPDTLINSGFEYVGIDLIFVNSAGLEQTVRFNPAILREVSVPEPGMVLILVLGFAGLVVLSMRRQAGREFGILPLA